MRCTGWTRTRRALLVAAILAAATACGGVGHDRPAGWQGAIVVSQNRLGGSALYVLRPGVAPRRIAVGGPGTVERSPSVAPGGHTLVFARSAGPGHPPQIWAAALSGAEPRRLTHDAFADDVPVFSPDGRRIAFVSDRGGSAQVWVMRRDGSHAHPVTSNLGAQERVSWSPDGARIAYACLSNAPQSGDDGDNTDICTIAPDGRAMRRLTADPVRRDSEPAWSPRGAWIVFVRDRAALVAVHPDGSGAHVVRPAGADGWAYPTWSPTGRSLLVLDRAGLRLRIGSAAGGVLRAIAHAQLTAAPDWWAPPGAGLIQSGPAAD